MGVHLFYEEVAAQSSLEADGAARTLIHRYYYDDISDEVMIRSFQSCDGKAPTFLGEERIAFRLMPESIQQRARALKLSAE